MAKMSTYAGEGLQAVRLQRQNPATSIAGTWVYPHKGLKVDTYAEEVVLLSVDIAVSAPERRGPFLPG